MKVMQIMLRQRLANNRARAGLRQMCVWAAPNSEYSEDSYLARFSAFEKDMEEMKSLKEGPLRWNPPSYKNENFLSLQKSQPPKPKTKIIKKLKPKTSDPALKKVSRRLVSPIVQEVQTQSPKSVQSQMSTPEYRTKNKRLENEEDRQMALKDSSVGDIPSRRAYSDEMPVRGNPNLIESSEKVDLFFETAVQKNLYNEVPFNDISDREISQNSARPPILEDQTGAIQFKRAPDNESIARSEIEEEANIPQRKSQGDVLRRKTQLRESVLNESFPRKGSLKNIPIKEKPDYSVPLKTKRSDMYEEDQISQRKSRADTPKRRQLSRETSLKRKFIPEAVDGEIAESASRDMPLNDVRVRKSLPYEEIDNNALRTKDFPRELIEESSKEVTNTSALEPQSVERGDFVPEPSDVGILRDTSTAALDEQDRRIVSHEVVSKETPSREAPKKSAISNEGLDVLDKGIHGKAPLKETLIEDPEKNARLTQPVQKSAKRSQRDIKRYENSVLKNKSKPVSAFSYRKENKPFKPLDEEDTPSIDYFSKESMVCNKKNHDALRKYIAEAEVELRVQKQMLNTQKEEFKRRLRRKALNPLAEIERNSKVHLQHPLDYFNKKNKVLLDAKKNIKKIVGEGSTTSTSISKINESMPVQSKVHGDSEPISKDGHIVNAADNEVIDEAHGVNTYADLPPEEEHQEFNKRTSGASRNSAGKRAQSNEIFDTSLNLTPNQDSSNRRGKKLNVRSENSEVIDNLPTEMIDNLSTERTRPLVNQPNRRNPFMKENVISSHKVTPKNYTKRTYRTSVENTRSQVNNNNLTLAAIQIPESPYPKKMYGEVYYSGLEEENGLAVGKMSHLDQSKVNLRKHFMDRNIPVKLNKSESYKYHPNESTVASITKATDDNISNIPSISNAIGSRIKENSEVNKLNQDFEEYANPPSEFIDLPEQKFVKAQNFNKTNEERENNYQAEWDSALTSIKNNQKPYTDESVPSKSLPLKDTSSIRLEKSNTKRKNKLLQIPIVSEQVKNNYQGGYLRNTQKEAYAPSLRNKPVPEYNNYNASRIGSKTDTKNSLLNSVAKQYREQQKTNFSMAPESFASVQSRAEENYNSLLERGKLSYNILKNVSSDTPISQLSKTSKINYPIIKNHKPTDNSVSREFNIIEPPFAVRSDRMQSKYVSKNTPDSSVAQKYTNTQKTFFDEPRILDQEQSFVESRSKAARQTPEMNTTSISKSDDEKQTMRSWQKLDPSMQSPSYDPFSSTDMDIFDETKNPQSLESDCSPSIKNKGDISSFTLKSNRSIESRDTLQDIEEGIPSSRTCLEPAHDAFNSFNVGKAVSETEVMNQLLRSRAAGINKNSTFESAKLQTVRSHSLPPKTFPMKLKESSPSFTSRKTSTKYPKMPQLNPESRSCFSSSSHQTGNSELNVSDKPRTSDHIREKYPTLFRLRPKHADPFDVVPSFTYEEREFPPLAYKNFSSNLPIGKQSIVNIQSSLGSKPSSFNKRIESIEREKIISEDQTEKDSFQKGRSAYRTKWSDRASKLKAFIKSSYGKSKAYHNSRTVDPAVQTELKITPSQLGPFDPSSKRSTSDSSFVDLSDSSQNVDQINSTNASATNHSGDMETTKKPRHVLYEKPDTSKTRAQSRFITPPPYDVENVDTFFRVDEPTQFTGSPIRKWEMPSREPGKSVFVASIPENMDLS